MKQADRTKVCWGCEADVSYEATYCLFCGTDLLAPPAETPSKNPKQDAKFSDQTLQESLASLYKPPYSARGCQGLGIIDEAGEVPSQETRPSEKDSLTQPCGQIEPQSVLATEKRNEGAETVNRGNILPLLFLMTGAYLCVLGILLLFCSRDGRVILEWSNRFWFVYCALSLPLLYFGIKMLKNVST